jgi:FkbM family methyltransferase
VRGRGDSLIDPPSAYSRHESTIAGTQALAARDRKPPLQDGQATASLTLPMDDREVRMLEAYAASRGTSLSQLVADFLRVAANDVATVAMPSSAVRPVIYMLRQSGADQIAGFLSKGRWDDLERPMPQVIVKCLRDATGLMLDVGAGTGFYSLLATACAPNVSIVAFEPYAAVADILAKNVELNGLTYRIAIERSAVSDRTGDASLFVPVAHPGTLESSASLESNFKSRHSQTIRVPTTTVDGYVRQLATSAPVCLIKIDVEGHETAVLEGAAAQIGKDRPLVFVRILDRSDLRGLTEFITEAGYFDLPLVATARPRLQVAVTFEPQGWDHVLVPVERGAEFLRLMEHAI